MQSSEKPYVCEYCGAGFMREKTLAVHMCEPKRRFYKEAKSGSNWGYMLSINFIN